MQTIDLTGHFLIAMPGMADERFVRTLTYICKHDEEGALGLIVNRAMEMRIADLFSQIGVSTEDASLTDRPLFFGGPVETERGFVLHQPVGQWQSTLTVSEQVGLTTSRDILDAMARGDGPGKSMVALGYAGWGAGQLEHEMAQNAWLSVPADVKVMFDLPTEIRLDAAAQLLGINYANLSENAGHA